MKKALVTGASSGIGEAVSSMLLELGYEVYGLGRDFGKCSLSDCADLPPAAGGQEPEGQGQGIFHRVVCDLADGSALQACIRNINREHDISLFVSNAGVGYYGLHEELDARRIHELTAVNLEAPMIIANMLLRDLKKTKGTLIFISSVTAQEVNPHGCAYGAVKAGLTSFAHSLFAEVRKYGVRVVNIEPDMTRTGLYRNADFECSGEYGACLEPEDVAEAVRSVLSLRDGMLYRDITLMPQLHMISRKAAGRKPDLT